MDIHTKTLIEDYKKYYEENKDFFTELENDQSILYFHISNILYTLDYFTSVVDKGFDLEQAEISLFSMGAEYLYDFKNTVLAYSKITKSPLDEVDYLVEIAIILEDFIDNSLDINDRTKGEAYLEKVEELIKNNTDIDDSLYQDIKNLYEDTDFTALSDIFNRFVFELDDEFGDDEPTDIEE